MLKLFTRPILGLSTVTLAFLMMSSSVFAQLSPPLSPWLGLQDRSRSPGQLDPYHRVVKPQQDMMKALATQASQIQNQQQALQILQGRSSGGSFGARDLSGIGADPSSAPTKDMVLNPPRELPSQKNPAGFNQYLHYYPPNSLPHRQAPFYSTVGRRR